MELALWSGGEHFKNEQDVKIWIDTARADCVDTLVSFKMNMLIFKLLKF